MNPDDADVFVIGLPYDLGTSGRSGTRGGPGGIRSASANLRWEEKRWPWDFNVYDRLRVADYGDLEVPTGSHDAFFEKVADRTTASCSPRAKPCSVLAATISSRCRCYARITASSVNSR